MGAREVPRAFVLPVPPPGVLPEGNKGMAMDDCISANNAWAGQQVNLFSAVGGFVGYAYLSELAQLPEYRRMAEIMATAMTRKWIKLQATGSTKADAAKADKLRVIEGDMKAFGLQDVFRKAALHDSFFGLGQVYVDTDATDDPSLLQAPLVVSNKTVRKGSLKAFRVVEPIWTYPNAYNSTDPLKPHYYKPATWFVMAKQVHSSRLLTFRLREMPDILKPAYNFGGLSLTQMAMPYVNNWIRTRTSVGDLVHNFSVMSLATDLETLLAPGAAASLLARAQLFNQTRDNRGLMMTNKDSEELTNLAVPLANLDKLQAQAQEQVASVNGIPLIIAFGITPSGLNATSEGELQVFADWILSCQEQLFTENLTKAIHLIQLNRFGEIDEEIGFEYVPLTREDVLALATVRKTNAETEDIYINNGVLDPPEIRERLATEEDSLYPALDLNKEIEPPGQEVEAPPEGGKTEEGA